MLLLVVTIVIVGVIMLAMAVGPMVSGRCLRGSCGGPDIVGADGEPLSCDQCPLRGRSQGTSSMRPGA